MAPLPLPVRNLPLPQLPLAMDTVRSPCCPSQPYQHLREGPWAVTARLTDIVLILSPELVST